MLIRAALAETRSSLKQPGCVITLFVLLFFVLANFLQNVQMYQGSDVLEMIHPMKLLVLSDSPNNEAWYTVLLQVYPIQVSLPAVLPYAKERQTGESVLLAARLGNLRYAFSRLISVWLTTFLVFTLPFLMEIGLNCISFPLEAQGDPYGIGVYDPGYPDSIGNYLFRDLYLRSPYAYAVAGTLFWGLCSGVFAVFSAAFVAVFRFKFTVLSMLPAFLFLNGTVMMSAKSREIPGIAWYHYLTLFNERLKNPVYLLVLPILLLVAILGTAWGGRQDCIG